HSVGYFGAVRLRDGRFLFSRETGKFNALTFFAFLRVLRRASIRSGRRVVVITDNVKYHHAFFTRPGAPSTPQISFWTICHPIAQNSTQSNVFGSLPAAAACTIATSPNWTT